MLKHKNRLAFIFNVLGDEGRFRVIKILARKKDICVSEIAEILKVSVPAASQQLKILEIAGIVIKERKGQMICYKLNQEDKAIRAILRLISSFKRSP